jgi:hypothetical protein
MKERSDGMEIASTDLLASLATECRKLVDASGLEDGQGGGWESYDCLLTELRKRLNAAEFHLANISTTGSSPVHGALAKESEARHGN